MSDVVISALIGVGGAVIVAICGVVTQICVTRSIIKSEREKLSTQLFGADLLQRKARRQEQILDTVAEILIVSDPESTGKIDAGRTTNLIVRLDLLLDREVIAERDLHDAVIKLGLFIRDYVASTENRELDNRTLLVLLSHVTNCAGRVIRELPESIEKT